MEIYLSLLESRKLLECRIYTDVQSTTPSFGWGNWKDCVDFLVEVSIFKLTDGSMITCQGYTLTHEQGFGASSFTINSPSPFLWHAQTAYLEAGH